MTVPFQTVAIIGLGLMGGSLGLALKARFPEVRVVGWTRRKESAQKAVDAEAVDVVAPSMVKAVEEADLVVYCAPILKIPDLVKESLDAFKPGAVLTDVGSTKGHLHDIISGLMDGRDACFIGSHPMCGSEQQGVESARADLYENASVIITPDDGQSPGRIADVTRFWESLGARVHQTTPGIHDILVARTSHLPHLAATLLAITVSRNPGEVDLRPFCGTGYRDTTRIAAGSPTIWRDIIETNQAAVREEMEAYRATLDQLIEALSAGDHAEVEGILEKGRQARLTILEQHENNE